MGMVDSDDLDESRAITAFGQLSLDENQEVILLNLGTPIRRSSFPGAISWEGKWASSSVEK